MRVVLTTESFLPYVSGVTVSVDALARGLGDRGHEVLVVAPRPARGRRVEPVGSPGPDPRMAWMSSYALPVVAPPDYRMPWPNPWAAAWREARRFRPDVVHAHSPFVSGALARRLARSVGAPLVFTHHTRFDDYSHYLGPAAAPGRWLTDAWLRSYWRGCAAVIAPSEDLAGSIRERLGTTARPRVAVIPTGIDVEGIRAATPIDPRGPAGWPADAIVVASLGRLAPEKSPDLLLEAVLRAMDQVPRLHLLVVGGGPSHAALERRASSTEHAARIRFSGPLPRPDAIASIKGADLFAFASRSETQGLVLAEALAAGLPAIALDGPGVGDSVRHGIDGEIVPSEPAATVAQRLADAIAGHATRDAERRRKAERAGDDAARFGLGRRVEDVESLYAATMGGRRAPAD